MTKPIWTAENSRYDVLFHLSTTQRLATSPSVIHHVYYRFALKRDVDVTGAGFPFDGIYSGVVTSASPFMYDILSQISEGGGFVAPTISITIGRDTPGGEVNDFLEGLGYCDQASPIIVRIFVQAHGSIISGTPDQVFCGYVSQKPYIRRRQVELNLIDPITFYNHYFPHERFAMGRNVMSQYRGGPIPIIYGRFDGAIDKWTVPAVCLNSYNTSGKLWQICKPNRYGLGLIGARTDPQLLYRFDSGDVEAFTREITNQNILAGTFETEHQVISTGYFRTYSEGDSAYVDYCIGNLNQYLHPIEKPIDVIEDLFTDPNYLNLGSLLDLTNPPDYLSDEAFTKVKYYISEAKKLPDLLREMLVSFGLIMIYNSSGKYTLHRVTWYERKPESEITITNIPATVYESEDGMGLALGQDDWRCDRISVSYDRSPRDGDNRSQCYVGLNSSLPGAEASIDMAWISNDDWAFQRASEVYVLRNSQIALVDWSGPLMGMDDSTLDILSWVGFPEAINMRGISPIHYN